MAKACASIMCTELEGETIERVKSIQQDLHRWVEHRISQSMEGRFRSLSIFDSVSRTDGLALCFAGGPWGWSDLIKNDSGTHQYLRKLPPKFLHVEFAYVFDDHNENGHSIVHSVILAVP